MKNAPHPLLLPLLFLFALRAAAQQDPNFQQGIGPFESLHGGDIDAVNLGTGNLYVHIPLAAYPQRGSVLTLSFSLLSNNKSYYVQCAGGGSGCSVAYWAGGGGSNVQAVDDQLPKVTQKITESCSNGDRTWNYTLQTADGYKQFLGSVGSQGSFMPLCNQPQIKTFMSPNGTGFSYTNSTQGPFGALLIDRSGIRYTLSQTVSPVSTTTANREDANGNLITSTTTSDSSGAVTSANYL